MIELLLNRNSWKTPVIFLFTLIGFLFGAGDGRVWAAGDQFSLTVMHLNDTHSHLEPEKDVLEMTIDGRKEPVLFEVGGYPRLLTKIREIRSKEPRALLVHAGDAVQGSLFFAAFGGKADMDFMNLARYDAMTVGNHEFDRGPELLAGLIKQAEFPILGANVDASAEPVLKGKIPPYVIKEIDGEKVALIGLVTPDTKTASSPGENVSFRSPATVVKELLASPELSRVNKIIVLSHLGYGDDLRLARDVEGIDVIVGGHNPQPFG